MYIYIYIYMCIKKTTHIILFWFLLNLLVAFLKFIVGIVAHWNDWIPIELLGYELKEIDCGNDSGGAGGHEFCDIPGKNLYDGFIGVVGADTALDAFFLLCFFISIGGSTIIGRNTSCGGGGMNLLCFCMFKFS